MSSTLTYKERFDGRKVDELRPMEAKVGVIPRATGSALFKIGKTHALAAVYGPRELYPQFLQDPQKGILRCNYNMLAFSGAGERVRPGPSRRSREISFVMEKALLPVLDMEAFPSTVIDVFVELVQTDAGIPMKDLIAAVAVGRMGGNIVLDVTKEEEDYEGGMADIPVAMSTRTGEVTLLQDDGDLTKEELMKALHLAKKGCEQIKKVQIQALKNRYTGE